jgi:predicted permease
MMRLVDILFPVFGLMILGGLLRQIGFLDSPMEKTLNRFCYFIALPVFIVHRVATAPLLDQQTLQTGLALQAVTLGLWLLALLLAPLFRVTRRSRGTFSQTALRGNLAYVGLPVLAYALADRPAAEQDLASTEAVLAMGGVVLLYNLLGVLSLEWDRRHEQEGNPWIRCLVSSAKNPLLLACFAGLIWNVSGLPMPHVVSRMATPVGSTAFPLALMAIGSRIRGLNLGDFGLPVLGATLMKNAASLGLGLAIAHFLGLEGHSRLILLILAATPTAVATYVLVDQMDGDRNLAASAIAISTVVSVLSLSAALTFGL